MDRDDLMIMVGEIRSDVKTLLERDLDREERLRAVERKQWYHTGAMAVVALVASKIGFPYIPHG